MAQYLVMIRPKARRPFSGVSTAVYANLDALLGDVEHYGSMLPGVCRCSMDRA